MDKVRLSRRWIYVGNATRHVCAVQCQATIPASARYEKHESVGSRLMVEQDSRERAGTLEAAVGAIMGWRGMGRGIGLGMGGANSVGGEDERGEGRGGEDKGLLDGTYWAGEKEAMSVA